MARTCAPLRLLGLAAAGFLLVACPENNGQPGPDSAFVATDTGAPPDAGAPADAALADTGIEVSDAGADLPDVGTADIGPNPCDGLQEAVQAELEIEFAGPASPFPGMVLALDHPRCGTVFATVGYSNLPESTPMVPNNVFHIASNTKTFVAAVVLQLAAEGALSLEDTVDKWRPNIPNAASMTVRHVVGNRSGIRNYTAQGGFWSLVNVQNTPDDILNLAIDSGAPFFAPGTAYQYSNTNFVLLGIIIEAVTGLDLHTVLRTRLLTPLGLSHTLFLNDPAPPEYVHAYLNGKDVTGGWDNAWDPSIVWGCADMRGDAQDLVSWYRNLVAGEVLDPASKAEMQTFLPAQVAPQFVCDYGLGLMRAQLRDPQGEVVFTAMGHVGGWESMSVGYYVPEVNVAAALLANHWWIAELNLVPTQTLERILVRLKSRLEQL